MLLPGFAEQDKIMFSTITEMIKVSYVQFSKTKLLNPFFVPASWASYNRFETGYFIGINLKLVPWGSPQT